MKYVVYLFAHVHEQVQVVLHFGQREILALLVHHVLEILDARRRFEAAEGMVSAQHPLLRPRHVYDLHFAQLAATNGRIETSEEKRHDECSRYKHESQKESKIGELESSSGLYEKLKCKRLRILSSLDSKVSVLILPRRSGNAISCTFTFFNYIVDRSVIILRFRHLGLLPLRLALLPRLLLFLRHALLKPDIPEILPLYKLYATYRQSREFGRLFGTVGPYGAPALAQVRLDGSGDALQVFAEAHARLVAHLEQELGPDALGVSLPVAHSGAHQGRVAVLFSQAGDVRCAVRGGRFRLCGIAVGAKTLKYKNL